MTFTRKALLCGQLLLMLSQTVIAVKIQETSAFQACVAAPTTCTRFNFNRRGLTGTIPSELGALSSLTDLSLGYNHLSGTLPSELAALLSLTDLSLDHNQIMGTIPSELATLTNLLYLDLNNNRLTGTMPSELAVLARLTNMDLDNNWLMGTVPTELGALTNLKLMYLFHNQLTGRLPSELAAITSLSGMYICNNNGLCGDIPAGVTPNTGYNHWQCPSGATTGTNLGLACQPSPPIAPVSRPEDDSSKHPLKDNWFRKRDVARKAAFPQRYSWFRKQAQLMDKNTTI
mmetsp:Transcript_35521/g.68087  ORF Transcript_35521/g.68087 Transcript_35521/m.68087 type:complete len:288 (-) Transcript_35521:766-1629(-)